RCPGLLWSRLQSSPSDLTKKRATFGPLSHAAVDGGRLAPPNPSQLLEITLFFTGCDPASTQVCHDRPRTRPGRKGRERFTFVAFPVQPRLGRWISSLAITAGRKTAAHPHKFQANNGRPRAGGALNSS